MTSLPVVPHLVTFVDCVLHTRTGESRSPDERTRSWSISCRWKDRVFQGRGEGVRGHDPTTEAAAAGTGTRRRLVIQCLIDCMVYETYACGYFSY